LNEATKTKGDGMGQQDEEFEPFEYPGDVASGLKGERSSFVPMKITIDLTDLMDSYGRSPRGRIKRWTDDGPEEEEAIPTTVADHIVEMAGALFLETQSSEYGTMKHVLERAVRDEVKVHLAEAMPIVAKETLKELLERRLEADADNGQRQGLNDIL
jgi:hypothetical protein